MVSPSTAFRTCPMCAALFGLMLVCSTIILSPSCAMPPDVGPLGPILERGKDVASALEESQFLLPRRFSPKMLRDRKTHLNTRHQQLLCAKSLRSRQSPPQSLAQSVAVRASTASPVQTKPAKPPRPLTASVAAPAALANSTPYFSRICRASASRSRFISVRYTRPQFPITGVIYLEKQSISVVAKSSKKGTRGIFESMMTPIWRLHRSWRPVYCGPGAF